MTDWRREVAGPVTMDGGSGAAVDEQRRARAAFMLGRYPEAVAAWDRAHRALLASGDAAAAARCLFWLTLAINEDDVSGAAQIGGWLARLQRLIDEHGLGEREHAYLRVWAGIRAYASGQHQDSLAIWESVVDVARRRGDHDIWSFGAQARGRTLIRVGRVEEGVVLLDEVLVEITSGEVDPMMAGWVYCGCLIACYAAFDPTRAAEWTRSVTQWLEGQPGLEAYTGSCLLFQSRMHFWRGEWAEASRTAESACRKLSEPRTHYELGAAFYQRGELFRVRGELGQAEDNFKLASRFGCDPQPGLGLLWLAQGKPSVAASALDRARAEGPDATLLAALLCARAEVAIAESDAETARAVGDELDGLADQFRSRWLRGEASLARGAALLMAGDARGAVGLLRDAQRIWHELEMPHRAARARVLLATACLALGDAETATLERLAARETFERLGAAPDLAKLDESGDATDSPLTPREREVVQQVAGGLSNRAIAKELSISEKTVASHLAHVFAKLGLPSRAAVTAWFYERGAGSGR